MLNSITLEQAIDTVSQLPSQQQKILIEIIRHRMIEARRYEIAKEAKQARVAFLEDRLKVETADEVIHTLHTDSAGTSS